MSARSNLAHSQRGQKEPHDGPAQGAQTTRKVSKISVLQHRLQAWFWLLRRIGECDRTAGI